MRNAAAFAATALHVQLGAEFAVSAQPPRLVNDQLFPDERAHVARAVAKRQADFGTARLCARNALAKLGHGPCSLTPNSDRSPRWPAQVRGSISHTEGCCVAVVTRSAAVLGVGVDVEQDSPLSPNLERLVCTPAERSWIDGLDVGLRGLMGKVIFSAKESFYKCQYPTTLTMLDFQDVELSVDFTKGQFRIARLARSGGQWNHLPHMEGQLTCGAGIIVTSAVWRARQELGGCAMTP